MGAVWRAWICPRRGETIINRLCPPAAAISQRPFARRPAPLHQQNPGGKAFVGQGFFSRSRRHVQPLLIPIQQLADVGDAIHLDPWTSAPFGGVGLREKNPAQSCCLAPSTSGSAPLIRRTSPDKDTFAEKCAVRVCVQRAVLVSEENREGGEPPNVRSDGGEMMLTNRKGQAAV